MISEPDRSKAIELIDEAHASGARLSKACEELGITERTYYRWVDLQKEHGSYEDRRPHAEHPEPANKLSPEERQQILDTVNDPKYASMPPCEIVPALADEGVYIASESTFYRVLREEKQEPGAHRSYAGTAMSIITQGSSSSALQTSTKAADRKNSRSAMICMNLPKSFIRNAGMAEPPATGRYRKWYI